MTTFHRSVAVEPARPRLGWGLELKLFTLMGYSGETWRSFVALRKRTLLDGTQANGLLMARLLDGQVQFRTPTDQEDAEYRWEEAW